MPRYTKSVKLIQGVGTSHSCESREYREGFWIHKCLVTQLIFISAHESSQKPGIARLNYLLMDGRCVISAVVTLEDYRGNGFATQLYLECIRIFGFIYSDGLVSRSAERVWKRLDSEGLATVVFGKSGDELSPNVAS